MTSEGSQTTPQSPSGQDEQKPFYTRWWFIAIAAIVGLAMLGSFFGDPDETTMAADSTTTTGLVDQTTTTAETSSSTTEVPESTTTTSATPTTTEPPITTTIPAGPEPVFGSGTQVVGVDVQPGLYETGVLGEGFFDGCYWERLSGFSGEFEEIITNNNVVVHDVVEIAASDVAFDSDCDEWFELTPLDEPLATIPQGKWVLGVQISAGTYQAGGGDTCYWERLSGVSGEFGDIIANDLPSGSAIVEISESDYAFNSTGCGEWALRP